jgi:hypothetical protein
MEGQVFYNIGTIYPEITAPPKFMQAFFYEVGKIEIDDDKLSPQ